MRIVTLVENTTTAPEYGCRHGLSLYIETAKHKILFDLGPDQLFAENAAKLNIRLDDVDIVIISHGHKDHGGALEHFLALNDHARIYIRRQAFDPHYIRVMGIPVNIGLNRDLASDSRMVFTEDCLQIDEELLLFSCVPPAAFSSRSNRALLAGTPGRLAADDFCHEQSLILTSNAQKVLVSGCSHSGIVRIQQQAQQLAAQKMDVVIGGFHLYNPPTGKYESDSLIDSVAHALLQEGSLYYTCHCTGHKAFERMQCILGANLQPLSAGSDILLCEAPPSCAQA